jgi:ABC-type Fe3+/spermidine/putrescine transport system ATPase subunit
VFVTHDQAESMALADRIIVMNRGNIEQVGTPAEIYERPRSRFVSEFVGSINVLPALVTAVSGSRVSLNQGGRQIHCVATPERTFANGDAVLISIRPEKLMLMREPNGGQNVWEGQVAATAYYGDHREYEIQVDEHRLKVTAPVAMSVERGDRVFLGCDPAEIVVMSEG